MAPRPRLISKRAYNALKKSFEHWCELEEVKDIPALVKMGYGSHECPLCKLYNPMLDDSSRRVDCSKKCPIAYDEDTNYCLGTPYDKIEKWSSRLKWGGSNPPKRVPRKAIKDMSTYLFRTLVNVRYE